MNIKRILQIAYLPVHPTCIGNGAQFTDGQWYMPRWGHDMLQHLAEFEREERTEFEAKKPIQKEAWAAIRLDKDSGREWLDRNSISHDRERTITNTGSINHAIPYWAADNPVVRIVEVVVKEKMDDE